MLALLGAPASAQDVAALFDSTCGACHQPGGAGVPGLAPPVADKDVFARLGEKAPAYVAGVMIGGLSGTIEAGGQSYIGLVMPPQDHLSDEDLLALGNYVLNELNGTGLAIDADLLAQTRKAPPSHKELRDMRAGG